MNKLRTLKIAGLLTAGLLLAMFSEAQSVTKVAGGFFHSVFLKADGSLWAMGFNAYGQLGDGTFATNTPAGTNRPEQIVTGSVTNLAAGDDHTLFIKSDGSLWAMGQNQYGQLGDGTTNNINHPEQIISSNVAAIAAKTSHSLFVKSDGSLWAMGRNFKGELGDGTTNMSKVPEQIVASNVTAVAAGQYHSLFLKTDGSLWAMGWNQYGQLGDGTTNNSKLPELIVSNGVVAVAAGYFHSLFIKSDGSLWVMGGNQNGQLGDGTTNNINHPEQIVSNNVTAIAGGWYHSLFVTNNSALWAMGANQNGQLGDGTQNNQSRPEQIVANNVSNITAGGEHSLFTKNDGSLWAMGFNYYGQLGDGTFNQVINPEQVIAPPPRPIITTQPVSQTNYFGATATFLVAAVNPQLNYQWFKNGTNLVDGGTISGSTTNTLSITNLADSDAGNYSVMVSNIYGSVISSNATLTVSDSPFIATQPLSQIVGIGSNATFNATAYGAPPFVFQWYFNGNPVGSAVAGTNLSYFTVTNVQTNQAGSYTVKVFGQGSVTSSNAVLTVLPFPPSIVIQPARQSILLGSNVTFTISISGTAPYTYQWLFNGVNISFATNATYSIPSVAVTNTGNYSVAVTNAFGGVVSSGATLTVIFAPTLALQILAGYPQLDLNGMINSNFVVQYSTNLTSSNWIKLIAVPNLSASPYQFIDPAGSGQRARYYRAFMQ
jgi:alpha-tubulin suppressor-like RCC1 family protein